jgi:hypothetical protein
MAVHKVTYKGLSDIREMTKKQLADVGIGMDGNLVWDKTKQGPVPFLFIEDASDNIMQLFKDEGTFTVVEVDDKGAEVGDSPVIKGASLDDTGNTVVDKTKGTTSTRTSTTGGRGSSTSGTGTTGSATGSTGKGSSTGGGVL